MLAQNVKFARFLLTYIEIPSNFHVVSSLPNRLGTPNCLNSVFSSSGSTLFVPRFRTEWGDGSKTSPIYSETVSFAAQRNSRKINGPLVFHVTQKRLWDGKQGWEIRATGRCSDPAINADAPVDLTILTVPTCQERTDRVENAGQDQYGWRVSGRQK